MRTKKILGLLLAMLCVFTLGAFVGCTTDIEDSSPDGEKQLDSIVYLSGMPQEVIKGTDPVYANVKIKAVYSDASEEEITYNQTDFQIQLDNSEVNAQVQATITYKEKTCTVDVAVVEFIVSSVEMPEFVNDYQARVGEESEFKDKTQEYLVGADSAFYFSPKVTVRNKDGRVVYDEAGEIKIAAEVYILNGEEYELLDNPGVYVDIDQNKASFDFTEQAVGKKFKLAVRPDALTSSQMQEGNIEKYTKQFEFKVVEGYNVYSVAELLLWDNRDGTDGIWASHVDAGKEIADLLKSKGITADPKQLKGLVLQTNLDVKKEDLPSCFFYSPENDPEVFASLDAESERYKNLNGSLKDDVYFAYRKLGSTGTFFLEGNYYTVSVENIPKIVKQNTDTTYKKEPGDVIAHSKLLWAIGDSYTNADSTSNTECVSISNVNLVGNCNRQDDVWSGGMIFYESVAAKTNITNTIARRWYITAFTDQCADEHQLTLDKVIFEDDYNSIIYSCGGILDVKDSILRGAGGPVIIADHLAPESKNGRLGAGGWITKITADDNSVLQSYVTGQEGWFASMGAQSAASQIATIDTLFNSFNRTYLTEVNGKKCMNLVVVFKKDETYSLADTFAHIDGYAQIGSGENAHVYNFAETYTNAFVYGALCGSGAPIFQSKTSTGIVAYNPTSNQIYTLTGGTTPVDIITVVTNYMMGNTSAVPAVFTDQGYLNLFLGTSGIQGYIGILLGDYKALK